MDVLLDVKANAETLVKEFLEYGYVFNELFDQNEKLMDAWYKLRELLGIERK